MAQATVGRIAGAKPAPRRAAGSSAPRVVSALERRASAVWTALGAPPRGTRVAGTVWVFALGVLVGAGASVHAVRSGINFDYGDSIAHLTIARRIIDGKTTGLQQLGTVWLPLPHLLLLPLVANLWLWHTGVAASVLGSLCLGATSAGLYRIMARLHIDAPGRLVGLVLLLTNVSLLYASTTALTEPVLIAAMVCCTAGLAGWALAERELSGGHLAVFAGIPAAAGVLTRYEGWALVMSGACYVAIVTLRRGNGLRRAVALAASFAAVPAGGIIWWLGYNMSWYGNPVEFLTGPYSASAFTDVFIASGELTTKDNLGLSFRVLAVAVFETAGLVTLVLAGAGLVVMMVRWGLDNRSLLVWLGGTSSAFLLVSLVGGQHIMVNSGSLPPGVDYNNRYVLSAIPWFALLAAVLVGTWRAHGGWRALAVPAVAVLMALQIQWWLEDSHSRLTVIAEGQNGHEVVVAVKRRVADFFEEHYDGGGILMDESADQLSLAPMLGIPLREIYYRASGDFFTDAIEDPYNHVEWVLMHRQQVERTATRVGIDNVTAGLANDPQFHARYALVYEVGDLGIYQRID